MALELLYGTATSCFSGDNVHVARPSELMPAVVSRGTHGRLHHSPTSMEGGHPLAPSSGPPAGSDIEPHVISARRLGTYDG